MDFTMTSENQPPAATVAPAGAAVATFISGLLHRTACWRREASCCAQ